MKLANSFSGPKRGRKTKRISAEVAIDSKKCRVLAAWFEVIRSARLQSEQPNPEHLRQAEGDHEGMVRRAVDATRVVVISTSLLTPEDTCGKFGHT